MSGEPFVFYTTDIHSAFQSDVRTCIKTAPDAAAAALLSASKYKITVATKRNWWPHRHTHTHTGESFSGNKSNEKRIFT